MICLMICLMSTSFMASEIKRMLLFAKTRKKEKEKDNYLHWEEGSYFVFKQIILTITFD